MKIMVALKASAPEFDFQNPTERARHCSVHWGCGDKRIFGFPGQPAYPTCRGLGQWWQSLSLKHCMNHFRQWGLMESIWSRCFRCYDEITNKITLKQVLR